MDLKNAIEKLEKEFYKNINMINFIKNNEIIDIRKYDNTYLIKGISDENWIYLSSDNESELIRVYNDLREDDIFFAAIEEWMIPFITLDQDPKWILNCNKYVFKGNKINGERKIKTSILSESESKYIYENYSYKEFANEDYIRNCIKNDISYGVYEDGILVAWVMRHDDGAIGMLNVIEEYRNRGYGEALVKSITQGILDKGDIAFAHIEEYNKKSITLLKKVGFEFLSKVSWFEINK